MKLNGRHDRAEAELSGSGDQSGWTAERVLLAITPIAHGKNPGGGEATVRWNGRGRYDFSRDELTIESAQQPDAAKVVTGTWIAGDQKVRISGVRSWPATEVEAAAKMDLASLGRLLSPEEQAWTGQLDALVRARP